MLGEKSSIHQTDHAHQGALLPLWKTDMTAATTSTPFMCCVLVFILSDLACAGGTFIDIHPHA